MKAKTTVAYQQFNNDIDIVNTQPLSSNYNRSTYGATAEDKLENNVCDYPEIFSKLPNKGCDDFAKEDSQILFSPDQ